MGGVANYLRQYDDFAIHSGVAAPEDWAARTYQGLVLELGQSFERKPLPRGFARMMAQACYRNAMLCAQKGWANDRYRYVEGYAGPFYVEHAWVLDTEDGKVFDPTWDNDANHQDYYGIVFPTKWAWRTMMGRRTYGLLGNDWEHRNIILKEGAALWTPEAEAA